MVRERLKRPFTLSEKVLYSHLADPAAAEAGVMRYLALKPGVF
jgi:hypothetical protein